MSNLLASLLSSTGALRAYDQVLEVTQNNVANASTPGYVKQKLQLHALAFNPDAGSAGGVWAGEVQSARDEYSEQAVRRQVVSLGAFDQKVSSLTALESAFDVSGEKGIPATLSRLYQSFSAWTTTPNSGVARQTVIDRASDLAKNFQQTALDLANLTHDTEQQLKQTTDSANGLISELRRYNFEVRQGNRGDAALDARTHAALEELSKIVDITATVQEDGSTTVLVGGKVPLLIGDTSYPLECNIYRPSTPAPTYPNSPANARILAADGVDVTAAITDGQLGALLDMRNRILPGYVGDAYQAGDLNRMAKELADRVNEAFTSGSVSDGPPAVSGSPLFTYDASNDTNVARTLAVDSSITPDQLAAIDPGPPYVANGVALRLSQLANPQSDADRIDSFSFSEFYGTMASRVGSELNDATTGQLVQQQLTAQAKELRQQSSGVSLDEEAALLIEFQRAYQANARFITVLNQLTEETVNLLR